MPDNGYIEFPVCNTNCTVGCQCQDSTATDCLLLPDVVVVKNIMESEHTEYPNYLTVTSATSNIGYGTIEFHGTNEWFCGTTPTTVTAICPDGSYPRQKIEQRIYKKSSTETVDYVDVVAGYMQHHSAEGHDHPHIDNWIHNSLRIKGRDETNPLTWPMISVGSKVSFCAENSVQCSGSVTNYCEYEGVSYDVDNDLANGRMGQFYGCNFQTQGVSVGYSDVYSQSLAGQDIQFSSNICNGKYYLVSHFDPDSIFTEVSKANNVSYIPVYLSQQQTACCVTNFEAVEITANGNGCELEFNNLTQPEANTWLWDFGDGTTSTDQFPTHVYSSLDTTYQVSLVTNNDSSCTNSYMKSVYVANCLVSNNDLINAEFDLQVSPNPFYNFTNLKLVLENQSSLKIEVYNALNQKVKTIQSLTENASGEINYQINLTDVGIYYLHIEIDEQQMIKKIVKF